MRKGSRRHLTAIFVNICLRIIVNVWYRLFRSSHGRCSVKKDVFKNFVNLIGKHLCWSLFLIKLQAQAEAPTQVLSCENYKIFKKTYVEEHLDEPFNVWCPLKAHTYLNLHLIILRSYLNVSYY